METPVTVASRYLEHLSAEDVGFLAATAGHDVEQLRTHPTLVVDALADDRVFEAVFRPQRPETAAGLAPFLVFAVAVARGEAELAQAPFVPDWLGARQRVPVFDAPALVNLVGDPAVRLFLAELLASYTHVASGSVWVQRRGGWQRRRWSELDPVRLAGLLDVIPEAEQTGVYRRLGDLALFLTGVFPDYAASFALSPLDRARLRRSAGARPKGEDEDPGGLALWEELGRRWYELARRCAPVPTSSLELTARAARDFPQLRRILNFVTDRWLFPLRDQWFPNPAT